MYILLTNVLIRENQMGKFHAYTTYLPRAARRSNCGQLLLLMVFYFTKMNPALF